MNEPMELSDINRRDEEHQISDRHFDEQLIGRKLKCGNRKSLGKYLKKLFSWSKRSPSPKTSPNK